jgi:hypothetical protein
VENTDGYQNTAIGASALTSNTTGSDNVANGYNSLALNTKGDNNVSIGSSAMLNNYQGNQNTAVGASSLKFNTNGNRNTALGRNALSVNELGDNNTAIGMSAGPAVGNSNINNTTAIGYHAKVSSSNTIRIGNNHVTQIGGAVGWSNLSDGRFKTSIASNVPGLNFIMKLNPITFIWDKAKLDDFYGSRDKEKSSEKQQPRRTGFIAQEVESAAEDIGYDFSGIIEPANSESAYNLRYAEFVVPMVEAIQEQQKQIQKQQEELDKQEERIEKNEEKIQMLMKKVEKLKN